jgi:hypothetical protein
MAIQLKLDYSKKLGLPQYSSHQFSVSLTSEVNDVAQIHAEVERIYHVLQDAVDAQIVNPGYMPGGAVAETPVRAKVTDTPPAANDSEVWKCSDAQKNLILDLVVRNHLDKGAVDNLAKERFGLGVKQLNKLQASGLIDELMGLNGGGDAKPRFDTGVRSAPRRTNGHAYGDRRAA